MPVFVKWQSCWPRMRRDTGNNEARTPSISFSATIQGLQMKDVIGESRRRAVVILYIGAAVGAALIVLFARFRPALEEWVCSDPGLFPERVRLILVGVAALCVGPLIAIATCLWRLGARTLGSQRFPPPGTQVFRSVPVLSGHAARQRGHFAQAIAVLLVIVAVALAILFWWFAKQGMRHI